DRDELPVRRLGDATTYNLIGGGSSIEQHMTGRLTATTIAPGGTTGLERPQPGEDLFLYVTDGAGSLNHNRQASALGQYDVVLARPDGDPAALSASAEHSLNYLSFYLPGFLSKN